jgi:hypothetical protein
MSGNCFEMGLIQAFLDGETNPEVSLQVSNHIAGCDRCALALAEAEEETSAVFAALDREMNTLVPTQRLWSRINETIAEEKSRTSVWQRLISFASVYLVSPSLAVAAGFVIVLGLFVAFWNPQAGNIEVGVLKENPSVPQLPDGGVRPTEGTPTVPSIDSPTSGPSKSAVAVKDSNYSAEKLRNLVSNASVKSVEPKNVPYVMPASASTGYLPGEESYVKTIAELRQNVDDQKDTALTPSSRVSYERDMAIVNDSIKRMKDVVRKNPRNQSAKQALYSSYQDKVDLLNSVVQREDLIASLR